MKQKLVMGISFIITSLVISSCTALHLQSSTVSPSPTNTITSTLTPTPTFTMTPTTTLTPSSTATPTLELPVALETPLPELNQVISLDNAKSLQLLGEYSGNQDGITQVSRNGKWGFFASTEGLEVYDLSQNKMTARLNFSIRHPKPISYNINWISVSSDGNTIGMVEEDQIVVFTQAGKVLFSMPNKFTELLSSSFPNDGISISPDGKLAAIVDCSTEDYRYMWNCPFQIIHTVNGEIIYTWDKNLQHMHGVSPVFSPDGSLLETQFDNTMWFWNTADWSKANYLPINSPDYYWSYNRTWSFSPDGKQVAAGLSGNTIQIWDISGRKLVHEYKPEKSYPFYSSDGKWLAGVDRNGNVAIWNITTGDLVEETTVNVAETALMLLMDGKVKAFTLPGHFENLWASGIGEGGFQFVNQNGSEYLAMLQGNTLGCFLSLDGQAKCQSGYTLLGSDGEFYRESVKDFVSEFHKGLDGSGEKTFSLPWVFNSYYSPGYDAVNSLLFYTTETNGIHTGIARDIIKNTTIENWKNGSLTKVAYSADGKYSAFGYKHDTFIWPPDNLTDGLVLFDNSIRYGKTFYGWHIYSLTFSPDSQRIAFIIWDSKIVKPDGGWTRHIKIMDVNAPYKVIPFDFEESDGIDPLFIAFSSDGSLLAIVSSDGQIRLINMSDGSVVFKWAAYNDQTNYVAFSPDGKLLASADDNGIVKLWGIWP